MVNADHTVTGGVRLEHEGTYDLEAKSNFDFATALPLPSTRSLPGHVPEASRNVTSLYAQDAWNPTSRVGVTAGLRLDRYTDFGATLNPRLAGVYRARPDLNFKVAYGRAVRSPSFLERFYSVPPHDREPRASIPRASIPWTRRSSTAGATAGSARPPTSPHCSDVIVPAGSGFVLGSRALIVNAEGDRHPRHRDRGVAHLRGQPHGADHLGLQHPEDKATGRRGSPTCPPTSGASPASSPPASTCSSRRASPSAGGRPRAAGDPRADLGGYTLVDLVVRGRNFHPRLEVAGAIQNLFDTRYADPSPARRAARRLPAAGPRGVRQAEVQVLAPALRRYRWIVLGIPSSRRCRGPRRPCRMPVDIQLPLFLKILTYDRSFQSKARSAITIGIVYLPGDPESVKAKDEMVANLKRLADSTIKNLPIKYVTLEFRDVASLDKAVKAGKVNVFYVAPGTRRPAPHC